jgi:hypothetical protein
MGEYFRVVNTTRRQYFSGHSLGMSGKFAGLQGEPLASLYVWVMTKSAYQDRPRFRGAWADDAVVIAGDEGVNEPIYDAANEYEDVSEPLIEEWIDSDIYRAMEYWERGQVDDDGRYVQDAAKWQHLAEARKDAEYPADRWEARLSQRGMR